MKFIVLIANTLPDQNFRCLQSSAIIDAESAEDAVRKYNGPVEQIGWKQALSAKPYRETDSQSDAAPLIITSPRRITKNDPKAVALVSAWAEKFGYTEGRGKQKRRSLLRSLRNYGMQSELAAKLAADLT